MTTKWLHCEQRIDHRVTAQELLHQMQQPRLVTGRSKCREPQLPVELVLIGRDEARPSLGIARFARQLERLPARVFIEVSRSRSLQHDLIALARDAAESA